MEAGIANCMTLFSLIAPLAMRPSAMDVALMFGIQGAGYPAGKAARQLQSA
jgi:hypothetical protein